MHDARSHEKGLRITTEYVGKYLGFRHRRVVVVSFGRDHAARHERASPHSRVAASLGLLLQALRTRLAASICASRADTQPCLPFSNVGQVCPANGATVIPFRV